MNLPPLRTIRENPAAATTPPPGAGPTVFLPPELMQFPAAARGFLAELVRADILTVDEFGEFLTKLGRKVGQLQTRDHVADALVGLGFLTRYVVTRALSGQTHGLVFGPHRVLDRLNSGSVGIVFHAEHRVLKRPVAIKAVSQTESTHASVIDRFRSEVRVLAKLSHPHIVQVHDAGVLPETSSQPAMHYLVMELVPGGDVENYVCERGAQPIGVACEWGRQTASALRAAHSAGLTHRDMKPSNMLLTDTQAVKLCDFGLVREFDSQRTQPRVLLGSLEFLAPEQWADAATAGPAADVYSLGVSLFWILTGHLPYGGIRHTPEMVAAIRTGTPRRLREVDPNLPAPLDSLLARMLSRTPDTRPTMTELEATFAQFAAPATHPAVLAEPILTDDDTLTGRLHATVAQLEELLATTTKTADLACSATLFALSAFSVAKPGESSEHQLRIAGYTRALAETLGQTPEWAMVSTDAQRDELARCAAAHDLGLVAVPDAALLGGTPDETHPVIASGLLDALARKHSMAMPYLHTLRAVARSHHERWDGSGFPDHLTAETIPPPARIVAVADAYDDLRRNARHREAIDMLRRQSATAFDPAVIDALKACEAELEQIFNAHPEPRGEEEMGHG